MSSVLKSARAIAIALNFAIRIKPSVSTRAPVTASVRMDAAIVKVHSVNVSTRNQTAISSIARDTLLASTLTVHPTVAQIWGVTVLVRVSSMKT